MALKIYFAGPLFQPYERRFISRCAQRLRDAGYEVFVPHEQETPKPLTAKICFETDIKGITEANVLLCMLDGMQVDDGTACEIGVFWAQMQTDPKKKRIIGLINDSRKQPNRQGTRVDINAFTAGAILDNGVYCYNMDEVLEELAKIEV